MTQKNAANGGVVASGVKREDTWPLVQRLWVEAMGAEELEIPACDCRTLSACPGTMVVVHEPACPRARDIAAYSLREVAETLLRYATIHERRGRHARAHELRRRAALLDVARLAIGEL